MGTTLRPAEDEDEVVTDIPPFARIYKSGRVQRFFGNGVVPASRDSTTAVSSKDVLLFPGVSARLFLHDIAGSGRLLPVIIYFHGGGFVNESAFSPTSTTFLNSLCSAAGALAVAVDYRRAPENPLPTAYNDAYDALQWVISRSEPWLAEHGNFEKLILVGDSAGGNIIHNILLRHADDLAQPRIYRAILIHPFFWGTTLDVGPRSTEPRMMAITVNNWKAVSAGTIGIDDPRINPATVEAARLARMRCEQVMVCVAGEDKFGEWAMAYYKLLAGSGFRGTVELVASEGKGHVFHLLKPRSADAVAFIRHLAAFIRPASVTAKM